MIGLKLIVDRYNKRASEKNRPNFPSVGHYDHWLWDMLRELYDEVFDSIPSEVRWWTPITGYYKSSMKVGIVPLVPIGDQEQINEAHVAKYTPSMQYIARETKMNVPFHRVSTRKERFMYLVSISSYLKRSTRSTPNFIDMAEDWNNGKLKHVGTMSFEKPSGINEVWKKLPTQLEAYHREYLKMIRIRLIKDKPSYPKDVQDVENLMNEWDQMDFLEPSTLPSLPFFNTAHALDSLFEFETSNDSALEESNSLDTEQDDAFSVNDENNCFVEDHQYQHQDISTTSIVQDAIVARKEVPKGTVVGLSGLVNIQRQNTTDRIALRNNYVPVLSGGVEKKEKTRAKKLCQLCKQTDCNGGYGQARCRSACQYCILSKRTPKEAFDCYTSNSVCHSVCHNCIAMRESPSNAVLCNGRYDLIECKHTYKTRCHYCPAVKYHSKAVIFYVCKSCKPNHRWVQNEQ